MKASKTLHLGPQAELALGPMKAMPDPLIRRAVAAPQSPLSAAPPRLAGKCKWKDLVLSPRRQSTKTPYENKVYGMICLLSGGVNVYNTRLLPILSFLFGLASNGAD